MFTVCVGGDPKDSLSPKNVDVCVVFISLAMSPLSHHVLVVKGGLAGSSASQHVSFSSIVATWHCWTKNVPAVTNAQEEHLFGKKNSWPATAFMEANSRATRVFCLMQQNGSQVSVVGFRSTLRVGLGSRDAARHCPIWQHLGMSRQQPNIAKATLRFLSYLRTWQNSPSPQ